MPSWEEWNEQLSNGQRDYSLYKILVSMDKRLESLEKRKWFNRAASFTGGIIGGFGAALGLRFLK